MLSSRDHSRGLTHVVVATLVAWVLVARTSALQVPDSSPFPVLSRLQGSWKGCMRYATGEALAQAPFTLTGSLMVTIDGEHCAIESSVVLPGGKERTVRLRSEDAADGDERSCLRFGGTGPIDALVTEIPPDTVLTREVERKSGRMLASTSMQLQESGELRQVAHELAEGEAGASATVSGVQMWTFVRDLGGEDA